MAPPYGRVVVGVNDSVTGLRALRLAIAEARRCGAPLHAVRAWTAGGRLGSGMSPAQLETATRAGQVVRHVFADIGGEPADLTVVVATLEGSPGRTLVAYADQVDDLLVVGARTRRLGRSVARYCVTHATCPTLAAPPTDLARNHKQATSALRRDIAALERGGG